MDNNRFITVFLSIRTRTFPLFFFFTCPVQMDSFTTQMESESICAEKKSIEWNCYHLVLHLGHGFQLLWFQLAKKPVWLTILFLEKIGWLYGFNRPLNGILCFKFNSIRDFTSTSKSVII